MTLTTCEHLINWLFYLVGPKFLQKSIIQSPAYIYTSHRVSGNTVRKGRYEDVLQFKVCILITSKSFPFFQVCFITTTLPLYTWTQRNDCLAV